MEAPNNSVREVFLFPVPYSLFPAFVLFPIPYSLFPIPCLCVPNHIQHKIPPNSVCNRMKAKHMTVFLFGVKVPRRLFPNNVDRNRDGLWRHAGRQIARLVAKLRLHKMIARFGHLTPLALSSAGRGTMSIQVTGHTLAQAVQPVQRSWMT